MRPSRVLRKIREGGVASCIKVNASCPRVVEVIAASGIDSVWLGSEHIPSDLIVLENQVRAAKIFDVDAIVRVPRGSYSDYIRGFEMDACGIMVPHVMGLEDAKKVVRMTKFMPVGRRALDGGNADGVYTRIDFNEYLETSARERFVIYQIEDPEPLEELEAIAELEGVDMLFFGPGDFSHAIGKPGEWDAPEILETRKRVANAARNAGKAAGTTTGNAEALREYADMGYNFLNLGADVVALKSYSDEVVAAFAEL